MVTLDPQGVAVVALLLAMYSRAVTVLRWRGYTVPRGQQAFWYAGTLLIAIALLGPPDALSDDLLSAHMAQHLLLADLAAPLLLAGMRTPVLQFLLPRPILVPLMRTAWLRRLFRWLRRPLVAMSLWAAVLFGWHLGFAFQGALENPWVHAVQHQSFFVASLLVWWSIIEPKKRHVAGDSWKAGQMVAMRLAGMSLGIAFILLRAQAYPWYGDRAHLHGLSVLADQRLGGALMVTVDAVIMVVALGFLAGRERGALRAGAAGSVS